jgi:O-antigen/teichoic acid export membrane protein
VVDHLGKASYGIWALVMSSGLLRLRGSGVRPAVVYFIARHDAKGESAEVNRYVNTAFVTFAVAGAVVFLLVGALAPFVPRLFHVSPEHATEASWAVAITGLSFALTLPFNAYSAVLVGKQRYSWLASTDLVVLAAKTTAIVFLLSRGYGIVALALVTFAAEAVDMTVKTVLAFRSEPRLSFAPTLCDRPHVKALLRYGGLAVLVGAAHQLIWRTDAIVIGAMISDEAIALFTVGANLAVYARNFVAAAGRVLTPAAAALDAKADRAGIVDMLTRGSRASLLLGGAILVYLVAAGEPFLGRWMGKDFRGDSATVLMLVALGAIAPVAATPFEAVLAGTARMKKLAVLTIVEGIANLALSIALAIPYGIVGVALGTMIPALAVRLIALPLIALRELGGSYGALARAWAVPALAGGITFVLLRLVVRPTDGSTTPRSSRSPPAARRSTWASTPSRRGPPSARPGGDGAGRPARGAGA